MYICAKKQNMQTFYDIIFPLKNGQASAVESLIVVCKGEPEFAQLPQFTNLKSLTITLQKPLPAPEKLKELKHLTYLHFTENTPDFGYIAEIRTLKQLKFAHIHHANFNIDESLKKLGHLNYLGIPHSTITSLPAEVGKLEMLKELELCHCAPLYTLPAEMGNLKRLEALYLAGSGIKALPDAVWELPALQKIDLTDCDKFKELPEAFLNFKGQTLLDRTGLQQTLSEKKFKAIPHALNLLKNRVFFNLYFEYYDRLKVPEDLPSVYEALNEGEKDLRTSAHTFLYRYLPTPFPAQATIHITPTKELPLVLKDYEDILEQNGITLAPRMDKAVTHLIVGAKPSQALARAQEWGVQVVAMGHLKDYLLALDDQIYLYKQDEDTRLMAENLRNLLKSDDDSNVDLGLQMALGGGLNDVYFYDILFYYLWEHQGQKQKLAGKILEKYLPIDVFEHLKMNKMGRQDHANEQTITQYLTKISHSPYIDTDKLAIKFYERFNKGKQFCLHQPQSFVWYCQKNRKNSVLKLSDLGLTALPDTLGDLKGIKILYLQGNHLTTLPATIENLTALDTLVLDDNRINSFPEILLKLPHLAGLSISNNGLTSLPANLHILEKLETLNLYGNQLQDLPEAIYNLPALRRLEIGGTNLIKKDFKKIQERMPYCKVIGNS